MKTIKPAFSLILLLCLAFIITACSKGTANPVQTTDDLTGQNFGAEIGNRNLVAMYDAVIDPDDGTFEITPVERAGAYHFPLTEHFPLALQITGYGFTPAFWADIKIVHPYPGSGIVGFDPRVIAIIPANTGNQVYFPTFDLHTNNAVVYQPDGYTKMYDNLAGHAGNANPFKSYFKSQPYRVWMSTGMTEETLRWYLDLDGFGGSIAFKFVLDISTGYPNPPTPVVDNADEPVVVDLEISDGLDSSGGNATVSATLLDWQGETGIKCKVEAPALFAGSVELFYMEPGPNPDEYIFEGTISNELNAPEGEYKVLLAAWDEIVGNHNFTIATASVESAVIEFNAVDVTPLMTHFTPLETYISGDYAYSVGGKGLYVFHITDSADFELVSFLEILGGCVAIQVRSYMAYIGVNHNTIGGLVFVNVSNPESPYIINTLLMDDVSGLDVHAGYAYIARLNQGASVVDISPAESAFVVTTVLTGNQAKDLCFSENYIYVAGSQRLSILDVNPPASTYVVKFLDSPTPYASVIDVDVWGDYVYAANSYDLWVVNVSTPENAYTVQNLDLLTCSDVKASGNYAYCVSEIDSGTCPYVLNTIDITTPGAAFVEFSTEIWDRGEIFIEDDIAFVSQPGFGLTAVDVDPSGAHDVLNTIYSTDDSMVSDALGDYVYTVVDASSSRINIMDVSNPDSVSVINSIVLPEGSDYADIEIVGNYAYIANGESGLVIVDLTNPVEPEVFNVIDDYYALSLKIIDGYAYIVSDEEIYTIDIDPPISASVEDHIGFEGVAGMAIVGDYAYVADDYDDLLHIVDIQDPTNISVVTYLELSLEPKHVVAKDGYAYVSCYEYYETLIVDVDPPGEASEVGTIYASDDISGSEIWENYLLIADESYSLKFYSLSSPESPDLIYTFDPTDAVVDILIYESYAYLSFEDGNAMKIFDLY